MEQQQKKHQTMATDLMYRAALAGDVPLLFTIIQDDPTSIHRVRPTSLGDTIAHVAALSGHADFIKEIVSRNPLLAREVNQQGYSPLHLASDKGQVEVVEELLRAGNDLCLVRDKDGKLPVHVAAMAGKLNVLKKLMEVDPYCLERLTARGETVLHLAVKGNQMQVIQFLADQSTRKNSKLLNMKDDKGDTALHSAAAGISIEMTSFLVRCEGIEVNAENKRGETPLGVILSLPPQVGGAAKEVNDIIRSAGGLPTNPRSVIDISLATSATSPSPPAATGKTEESDDHWLKDMRKRFMVVAALIASITFQAGTSIKDADNIEDSAASAPSVNYNEGSSSHDLSVYLRMVFRLVNMISLFSSLTVIILLLTKFSAKKKYLVNFLSWMMHLSIYCVGWAFLALYWANSKSDKGKVEMIIITIFQIGWVFFWFDAFFFQNVYINVYIGGWVRPPTPKSKLLASLFLAAITLIWYAANFMLIPN